MAEKFYRRSCWHKNWHLRPNINRFTARAFYANLLLIHISCGATEAGDPTAISAKDWRPPESELWYPPVRHGDSLVTTLIGSLDHSVQSHRPARRRRPLSSANEGIGNETPGTRHGGSADLGSNGAGVRARPPHAGWTKRSGTTEKHFLFWRDLSKTQDTSFRQASPSSLGLTGSANRTEPICQDQGSIYPAESCTPNPERPRALMTRASNSSGTEDFLVYAAPNRSSSTNGSGLVSLEKLELATLQPPSEENHTHYYTVVNLDSHNDVLCDDEYQMKYNENCFIDHNVTCVGDPDFCNLTYDEYRQLLMDYIYPSTGEWILIASHTVVFIMGLVGNALVCIAVYTNHTMRTVTNIFIVNLAVADFFVILFCLPPTVVWDVTETWFMGKAMCKVVIYFQTVSVTVSVLTLTFISIDRWYAICFPLRYKPRPERAWRSIALIWLIGFLSDLPEFLVLTTRRKKLRFDIKLFTQCVPTWDSEKDKAFYIVKFVLLYTLPLLFMTVAYFQIVRVLWRSDTIPGHRESRNQPLHSTRTTLNCVGNTSTMGQLRARRKAAKMLVAVVIMFAGCYFPVHMLNVARYTVDIGQNDIVAVLSLFSHWLCYANSAVNPVIYNFMSGKFRREFKNALEKCRCLRNRHSYGGRVRGYDDRSFYHTATQLNVSPSTRSNYHLASIRNQHTQQTSFSGSRHRSGRNSINHPGNLLQQQQSSPTAQEQRFAAHKPLNGESLQMKSIQHCSTLIATNSPEHDTDRINDHTSKTSGNGNGAAESNRSQLWQSLLQEQAGLHRHQKHHQHNEHLMPEGGAVAVAAGAELG